LNSCAAWHAGGSTPAAAEAPAANPDELASGTFLLSVRGFTREIKKI
jgi:hypothetical protein